MVANASIDMNEDGELEEIKDKGKARLREAKIADEKRQAAV